MNDASSASLLVGFITVAAVSFAVILALVVAALVQVAQAPGLEPVVRAVWVLIILVAPVLGAVAWFAIGQKSVTLLHSDR